MTRIEWIPVPERRRLTACDASPPVLGYYAAPDGHAVALRATETLPGVSWTVTARLLEALPAAGHVRPTALHETATCTSPKHVRGLATLMVTRLLDAARQEAAA